MARMRDAEEMEAAVLPPLELGKSCWRLMAKMLNHHEPNVPPRDWELLSPPEQESWLKVGMHGPAALEKMEGQPFVSVAESIFQIACTEDVRHRSAEIYHQIMPPDFRLRWEIISRHLAALIDCDEIGSIDDLETMMLLVYADRLKKGLMR